jgi:hypothetical protein
VNDRVGGSCVWQFPALPQKALDFQPISVRMMIRSFWPAGRAMLVPRVDARSFPVHSSCHRSLTTCILPPDLGWVQSNISTKLAEDSEIDFGHVVVAIFYPDLACQSACLDLTCRSLCTSWLSLSLAIFNSSLHCCLLTRISRGVIILSCRRAINSINLHHLDAHINTLATFIKLPTVFMPSPPNTLPIPSP